MKRVYEERVFSGLLAVLPGSFSIILLGIFIYNQFSEFFEDHLSSWLFLGIGLFLLLVAINFAFLTIGVSASEVSARFGILSHSVPVKNIAGLYEDKTSSASYGGFGIRLGWVNAKRRLVYNIPNAPRIVLQQRSESNREFVFSTRNPEGVMIALKEVLGTR